MKKIIGLFVLLIPFFALSQSITIQPFSSGVNNHPTIGRGNIRDMFVDTMDNSLYAVGDFVQMGGKMVYGVAKWDGIAWDSLGSGIREFEWFDGIQHVDYVTKYKNEIYISGAFYKCGRKTIWGIARWNGTEWNDVGGSMKGYYPSGGQMEVYNNELYLIGKFDTIGNIPSKGIAKWDGNTWTDLSQNFYQGCYNDGLFSLIHYNNELYVGGNINCPFLGERLSKRVGNTWVQVGPYITGDARLNKLRIFQNNLYIGGYFFAQDGNLDNSFMYYNGNNFFPTAGGILPSNVLDMIDYKNELYVCGQINYAGFQPMNRTAKWTGTQWVNTGIVLQDNSNQLNTGQPECWIEYNNKLVIGGFFKAVNGVTASGIASIDFGGVSVNNLDKNSPFKLYPNPTNSTFSLEIANFSNFKSVSIYNSLGQTLLQQKSPEKTFDVSNYAKGMYVVEVQTDKGISRQKLMVE